MSKLGISTGTTPNDGTGDSLLAGAIKINSNFNEIYSTIGNGSNLGIGSLSSLTVSGDVTVNVQIKNSNNIAFTIAFGS
jgi:hypothetical protein